MTDVDSQSARRFFARIREFSLTAQPWDASAVRYETRPDEQWDLTLVSQRVYGRRDEYLAVMAAAGLDSVDQPLAQRLIVLPTPGLLDEIKRQTGFESRDALRGPGGARLGLGG